MVSILTAPGPAHGADRGDIRALWPEFPGKTRRSRELRVDRRTHGISNFRAFLVTREHFTREHWRTENSLHWGLDGTMNEDQARNRTGREAENLALRRRTTLNFVRAEISSGSMRGRIKHAGWNDDVMRDMIRADVRL